MKVAPVFVMKNNNNQIINNNSKNNQADLTLKNNTKTDLVNFSSYLGFSPKKITPAEVIEALKGKITHINFFWSNIYDKPELTFRNMNGDGFRLSYIYEFKGTVQRLNKNSDLLKPPQIFKEKNYSQVINEGKKIANDSIFETFAGMKPDDFIKYLAANLVSNKIKLNVSSASKSVNYKFTKQDNTLIAGIKGIIEHSPNRVYIIDVPSTTGTQSFLFTQEDKNYDNIEKLFDISNTMFKKTMVAREMSSHDEKLSQIKNQITAEEDKINELKLQIEQKNGLLTKLRIEEERTQEKKDLFMKENEFKLSLEQAKLQSEANERFKELFN